MVIGVNAAHGPNKASRYSIRTDNSLLQEPGGRSPLNRVLPCSSPRPLRLRCGPAPLPRAAPSPSGLLAWTDSTHMQLIPKGEIPWQAT